MNRTNIEWVKNPDGSQGYTHNPMSGCRNHTPEGLCLDGLFPCYAYKLANGRLKPLYLANENVASVAPLPDGGKCSPVNMRADITLIEAHQANPFYPRFWEERVREEFGAKTAGAIPKGIFVCDMGDLFGIGVPEQWTRRVLSHIGMSWYSEHRFYLLTKQPQNLVKFSPFPDNCWVGVTATNANYAVAACYGLQDIEAKVKFLSIEPLLAWVLSAQGAAYPALYQELVDAGINWLIIGACTGTNSDLTYLKEKCPELELMQSRGTLNRAVWTAQPRIKWVREIAQAADKAGVKVFLKDDLEPLIRWPQDGPWAFKEASNMLRQEIPK